MGPIMNDARFDAFVSYSHDDEGIARRLAERMSRYRVPQGLGLSPRRLRIFRDVERLTAHPSISEALRDRIRASDHLVLLASPVSALSRYVDEEAGTFLQQHGASKIVIALAAGDPPAALPPSVQAVTDEPLTIDLRPRQGYFAARRYFRAESLRIIAAVLNVDYDTLYRRDARRARLVGAAVALAVVALAFVVVTAWMITQVPAERWESVPVPHENTDSDLLVVRNLAVNRRDPTVILFRAQDNRNYVNELEVEQIRTIDGDDAADAHMESFDEGWDAAWAEWHLLRSEGYAARFVEYGLREARWQEITVPGNDEWAWYQPPSRSVFRDQPAKYRREDPLPPALRAILTERVPEPAEWLDRVREIVIISRASPGGASSAVTVRDVFTRQLGVTQTRTAHFLRVNPEAQWREVVLAQAPEGTTIEDVQVLTDARIALTTDRAGLFMAGGSSDIFREFNLGVRELAMSPGLHLISAGKPPVMVVLAPPQATDEHASTGTVWRYQREGLWGRFTQALSPR